MKKRGRMRFESSPVALRDVRPGQFRMPQPSSVISMMIVSSAYRVATSIRPSGRLASSIAWTLFLRRLRKTWLRCATAPFELGSGPTSFHLVSTRVDSASLALPGLAIVPRPGCHGRVGVSCSVTTAEARLGGTGGGRRAGLSPMMVNSVRYWWSPWHDLLSP